MGRSFANVQFLICVLIVIGVSPLAAYYGSSLGWPPGAGTFVFLAIPTFAAALTGSRSMTLAVLLLAILARFAESLFFHNPTNVGFTFPFFALCLCFTMSALTLTVVHFLRRRVSTLEEQNSKYVRDIYERTRLEEKQLEESKEAEANADEASAKATNVSDSSAETSAIDNAMLLLTIQDISRRISTNLDLDTLLPIIINTAKTSLKCDDCQVYFWNPRENSLSNAIPAKPRDASEYVPSPKTGMAAWVMQQRQILTRKDVESDYSLQSLKGDDPDMPDAIAPLAVGGELLGLLVIDRVEEDSSTFVRLLYILANNYALGIKNAQLFMRIEDMARRDGLTGLLNHASFQHELDELCQQAESRSETVTVVMSDVDHFKKFNDTYGHQAGDHVLREVARMFQAVMPDHSLLARYGGEEFICALPGEGLDRGRELAERLRESLATRTLDFEGQEMNVTASFGVAEFGPRARNAKELVRFADEALYQAKESGRDRVVCSDSDHVMINDTTVNNHDTDQTDTL